ncbi:MAG: aspartate/glutamate racemase family protein [Neisseriaceae bacterium]|nr:aspartate/glutamate racemase family protein [Neisseriaceae bacterium]MBP6862765.1 aspartate/glutamate racemase family protein [Neisseriaceae bacterium]
MKIIGMIGGMSWTSSQVYYEQANRLVAARLGGLHSAKIILYSVDFAHIAALQQQGEWQQAGAVLAEAAQALERAGAELIVLCTNTMHKVAAHITAVLSVPFIHIADATGQAIQAAGLSTVALLGTDFTMTQAFYRQRLTDRFGLTVLTPAADGRAEVHRIIYEELCLGQIKPDSKAFYLAQIEALRQQGAQGVILGCTEIGLLIQQSDLALPVFDTTEWHIAAAVTQALAP